MPIEERLIQNEESLATFLSFYHVLSLVPVSYNPIWFKSNILYVFSTIFFSLVCVLALCWPFLAWYDYKATRMDTNYWTLRYILYFWYLLLSNIRLGAIDCAQLLICEGILLSQITSILLYNEMSLDCLLFCLPAFLLV